MNLTKYFENEFAANNEDYLGMNGQFADDYAGFNGAAEDAILNVAGEGQNLQSSQPYVITVENTTTADVTNYKLFDAYVSAPTAGAQVGLSISVDNVDVTYTELLYSSMNRPFAVGEIHIQSTNALNITSLFSIEEKDINGNKTTKQITPRVSPNQYQSTIIIVKVPFRVTGSTTMTVARIKGSSSVTYSFYPSEKIDLARDLAGAPVRKRYLNPQLEGNRVLVANPRALGM